MNQTLTSAWNRFFFDPADPRIYAGFRIGFGVLLLINGAVLAPDWLRWFSDTGVLDRKAGRANIDPQTWSVFTWLPGTAGVLWTCFAIFMTQALALTLGIFPRVQAACLFIWLLSLHHRNNLIWDGEDVLFRLVCFLLIFMPISAAWSLTRSRRPNLQTSLWPLRLLQIQLTCLYLSSVLCKLLGEAWLNGTALHYAIQLDDFARAPWLAGLFEFTWLLNFATWLVIGCEALLIFGVWVPRMRRPTIVIGLCLHLGIELTLNLFLFQWLMILILLTHLKPSDLPCVKQPRRQPSSRSASSD
ncbi:MAG: hypothetical protein ACI8UO_003763 [Verrucomicrobiales bacterium]